MKHTKRGTEHPKCSHRIFENNLWVKKRLPLHKPSDQQSADTAKNPQTYNTGSRYACPGMRQPAWRVRIRHPTAFDKALAGIYTKIMRKNTQEEMRCFVNLPDGSQRLFPTATEIRDTEAGGIEIWNERIILATFHKGEFLGRWMNPQFLTARTKRARGVRAPRRR
ncbi:MAG: hypothetical protein WAO35_07945 [Terriglobia bacterium]